MNIDNHEDKKPKVTVSFRCTAEVKQDLVHEAHAAGIDTSQYIEMLVINRANLKEQITRLKRELANSENNLSLTAMRHTNEKNALLNELEKIRSDNELLKAELYNLKKEAEVLYEPRLLEIFQHVKGVTKTVERVDGSSFSIQLQSPSSVLRTMIYSFDYRK